MTAFTVIVSPHVCRDGTKHPNAFEAQIGGELICTSETPLLDAARALLKAGKATPDDVLVMRHAGSDHDALRARVDVAARLMKSEPKGKGRLRLVKAPDLTTVWPSIEQMPSLVPEHTPALTPSCGA